MSTQPVQRTVHIVTPQDDGSVICPECHRVSHLPADEWFMNLKTGAVHTVHVARLVIVRCSGCPAFLRPATAS